MSRFLAFAAVLALAGPQFTSGVNQVEIYASATDADGRPVTGLWADDFEVLEDGVPQRVTVFAEADFPLAAAVAVDSSFSMTGERLAVAKSSARSFLGALRDIDQAMLLSIGGRVEVLAPLSTDRAEQHRALDALRAWGTTSLHDAVIAAIDRLQPATGRRALVLLSDGDDRYSDATTDEVIARAQASDVMIYPVALGKTLPPLFTRLAQLSGGRAYHARDSRRLPATLEAIAADLRSQYMLGYTPSRPFATAGREWRDIDVRVNRPRVTVRARDGYYAGTTR